MRPRDQIGFATVRGGDVVGDHTVLFAADGERARDNAQGFESENIRQWCRKVGRMGFQQEPGLYSMKDVLGILRVKPVRASIDFLVRFPRILLQSLGVC